MKAGTLRKAEAYGRMPIPSMLCRIHPDLRPHLEAALMRPLLCVWQPRYRVTTVNNLRLDIPKDRKKVISPAFERKLFLWFNGCRYMVMRLVGQLPRNYPPLGKLRQIATWQADAKRVRDALILAHEPLIKSIMHRHHITAAAWDDAREMAIITLCGSVDRFDPEAGYRFATYAFTAIARAIQRSVGKEYKRQDAPNGSTHEEAQQALDPGPGPNGRLADLRDAMANRAGLDPRERLVLRKRYGLQGERPHGLREVGYAIGLSRERVRQIEASGLAKLRNVLL